MNFVGIDLHKQTISVCVVSQERKVSARRTFRCAQPDRIRAYFATLGEFQAVIEATASYEWLWVLLDPLADRIVLAHPGKMRIIAESTRKSDKLDAEVLVAGQMRIADCGIRAPSPGAPGTGQQNADCELRIANSDRRISQRGAIV